MSMLSLLEKMFIFVALMAIGYVSVKTNYISKAFVKDASKVVMNIFMSATIVYSCLGIDGGTSNGGIMYALLVMTVTEVLCFVIGGIGCVLTPIDLERKPVYEMLISMPNSMFIALPVLSQVYGPKAVFYCALSSLPVDILMYTYGVMRLKRTDDSGVKVRDIITAPLVASFVGVIIFFLRVPVPEAITSFLSILSGATMPLSMIVVGASLGSVSAAAAFKEWRLYLMSFIRLIISPLIVWMVVKFMTADFLLIAAAVIIAASPTGITVSVLSTQYERDDVFAAEGVLLSTMLSMITIPLVVWAISLA